MTLRKYGALGATPTSTELELCPSTLTEILVVPVISNGAKQTIKPSCTEMSGAEYSPNDTLVAPTTKGRCPVESSFAITVVPGPRCCPVMLSSSPGATSKGRKNDGACMVEVIPMESIITGGVAAGSIFTKDALLALLPDT